MFEASVYHALVVIFLEFFAWGLLMSPIISVSNNCYYFFKACYAVDILLFWLVITLRVHVVNLIIVYYNNVAYVDHKRSVK